MSTATMLDALAQLARESSHELADSVCRLTAQRGRDGRWQFLDRSGQRVAEVGDGVTLVHSWARPATTAKIETTKLRCSCGSSIRVKGRATSGHSHECPGCKAHAFVVS